MQAFSRIGLQKGLAGCFVVPGLVGLARLQGREDMNQSRVVAPFLQDLLDEILFSRVFGLPEKLNRETILFGDLFSIGSNLLLQRLGPLDIIKDPDLLCVKIGGHSLGITKSGKCALDDNAVIAGKDASNFIVMTFKK